MQRPVHDHLQVMAEQQQNGVQERKGSSTSQQAYISQGIFILNFIFPSSLSVSSSLCFFILIFFLVDVPYFER